MPISLEIEPKIEKMRHLPMPKNPKELFRLAKKEEKRLKKLERKNHKEKLGPYRLFLIGDSVFRQDEFPGNRIPPDIKKIGKEI